MRVAIGRFDGTNWTSEGWWTVEPKTCAGLLTGPLQARYYYLYATDGAAGTWEGKTHFCVAPDKRNSSRRAAPIAPSAASTAAAFLKWIPARTPDWTQTLSN